MSQQSLKDRYAAVMMNAFGAPLRVLHYPHAFDAG